MGEEAGSEPVRTRAAAALGRAPGTHPTEGCPSGWAGPDHQASWHRRGQHSVNAGRSPCRGEGEPRPSGASLKESRLALMETSPRAKGGRTPSPRFPWGRSWEVESWQAHCSRCGLCRAGAGRREGRRRAAGPWDVAGPAGLAHTPRTVGLPPPGGHPDSPRPRALALATPA